MSDKQKWPREQAAKLGNELALLLSPYCERIQIAGSIRRLKDEVGDIELLFIPRIEKRQADFLISEPVDLADEKIGLMLKAGELAKRPSIRGTFTWGPKNKLAIHASTGIPVDLFSTTEKNWWVSLVIRTGSKETNLSLTNGAIALGRSLNAYGCGVTERSGNVLEAKSEKEVFALCGVRYREPQYR